MRPPTTGETELPLNHLPWWWPAKDFLTKLKRWETPVFVVALAVGILFGVRAAHHERHEWMRTTCTQGQR